MSERGWCEWCEGRCQSVDGSGVRGDVSVDGSGVRGDVRAWVV